MTRPDAALRTDAYITLTAWPLIHARLPTALTALADNQPGYPSGTDGPRQRNTITDRTGTLAARAADGKGDQAWTDRNDLDAALARIRRDTRTVLDITTRWQPPTGNLRADRQAEATANDRSNWCDSCARVGSLSPRRERGRLCRWCDDIARHLDRELPPVELVERHAQGRRITQADLDRAKAQTRRKKRRTRR